MEGAFLFAPMTVPLPVDATGSDAYALDTMLAQLFDEHATALVRLARLFVDDRDAAEDLVQEAFLRLAHNVHRLREPEKAAPYLRSIVLNLARDHNRRGLVSLRHRERARTDAEPDEVDRDLQVADDQRAVIDAVKMLPTRQRDCVVLRYYVELPIAEVAATLGISVNSVKTHLQRALSRLEHDLEDRQ